MSFEEAENFKELDSKSDDVNLAEYHFKWKTNTVFCLRKKDLKLFFKKENMILPEQEFEMRTCNRILREMGWNKGLM
jgi:hypothetical protein